MVIKKLLKGLKYEASDLDKIKELNVNGIEIDSRLINEGNLFIAIKGRELDGHKFVLDAIKNGAVAVVINKDAYVDSVFIQKDVLVICVDNTRAVLPKIVAEFFERPTEKFKLVGITGTNGKTSVSTITNIIYQKMGASTGVIGTINNYINDEIVPIKKTNPTTPDCVELMKIMDIYRKNSIDIVFMEVSSMALKTKRVDECDFDIGVFTNLSPEHLDDHRTMEDYINSKLLLFPLCRKCVVNADDELCGRVLEKCSGEVLKYGIRNVNNCDVYADNIIYRGGFVEFDLCYQNMREKIKIDIPSEFAIYNILAAISICLLDGLSLKHIVNNMGVNFSIEGRFEILKTNEAFSVIIDYAHTPAALENLLKAVKMNPNYKRVITVFGCGGNRDKSKRAPMGRIVQKYSDISIVTSDNPRWENELEIIEDILKGMDKKEQIYVENNRRKAISKALQIATENDVIVIAGKGHEDYQIIKDKRIHFKDKEVVYEELNYKSGEN